MSSSNHPAMHRKLLPFLAITLALAAPALRALSLNDRVLIDVTVDARGDRKKIKGTSVATITQEVMLHITVRGKPKSPETRTGTWTIYGRDLSIKTITAISSGKFTVDLSKGPQVFTSEIVNTTSTAAHSVATGTGTNAKAKKVDADGTKYVGYSVVVQAGDTVVGEAANPTDIRKSAEK
jgi:hypothetical protein